MFIARAMCGLKHVTVTSLCCSCSLLCISKSNWATENEAGRSVSVNGNEKTAGEIRHQYSSVVTAVIPKLHTIKLLYTELGDYWEGVRPAGLRILTWVQSSGVSRNFFGVVFNKFGWGQRTDRTGIWGPQTPNLEAAVIWYKKFHFI